ncbi:MAG: SgcJ/EcaC family oxidoreductase [Bacteroidales bacterium]|nr:SgcJ/EcaC family oxidoreductase [Bacteroidales bacterium]
MKIPTLIIVLGLLSFTGKGQDPKERELVNNVILEFQDDFNDGDFKNAVNYSTTDWEHVNPNGGISKGRENVLKEVRAVHQSFLKGVSMKIETMEIRFLTPAVAVATVIHGLDDYITPDGNLHKNERQMKTYIVIKQEGKWLLAHDHNTVIS